MVEFLMTHLTKRLPYDIYMQSVGNGVFFFSFNILIYKYSSLLGFVVEMI